VINGVYTFEMRLSVSEMFFFSKVVQPLCYDLRTETLCIRDFFRGRLLCRVRSETLSVSENVFFFRPYVTQGLSLHTLCTTFELRLSVSEMFFFRGGLLCGVRSETTLCIRECSFFVPTYTKGVVHRVSSI